jgi:FAD/FMN-containing dehydrogenase/Fe-S oxidoreductase
VDKTQRERVRDDLKGLVKGEVLFDDLTRALYSTDASIFQVEPIGVVAPRDEADAQAVVRYAAEHRLPLVPRGAGTGFAGEALGTGLVLDLSRHFRSILEIGTDFVRVQPGVVYHALNAELAKIGRRFAPDPASGAQCTIGGMLATNASGARALRHGYTRDHVAGLRVVLDTGDIARVGSEPRWPSVGTRPARLDDILSSVATLLEQNAELIRASQPRTRFNRCGYLLDGLLHDDRIDLHRLLVGSEGTLAVFTEATLRTVPVPAGRSLVLLGFESVDAALRAAQRAISSEPVACDLLDQRLLTLARGGNAGLTAILPPAIEAALLVEYESETSTGAREAALELAVCLHRRERVAPYALVALEPAEIERLWGVREAALPSLYGLRGGAQPIPFVEDLAVPPEDLPDYLRRVQDLLQKHETTASFLVHAASGQVHARPFLNLERPEDVGKLWAIADEIYALTLTMGGTISTQHGTGLARTPWVAQQYGQLYPVFRELKAIFDPGQLLNPGKIVGQDIGVPGWPLRTWVTTPGGRRTEENPHPPPAPRPPLLHWEPGEMRAECIECNGCGHCRTEAPALRMCPIFRACPTEAATPRAKANLMRYLLRAGADPHLLPSDEVRTVADLCVNCKMCAVECPAHVNIPKLMLEAKAANVAEHDLSLSDWAMARTESFAQMGSALATLTNLALGSPAIRWVLDKVLGLSRHRRLPTFARYSFLRRARRRGWTRPPRVRWPRVAYFVDIFANYNDPSIGEATVSVLHHNGIEVYVPPGQFGCGMAPLAYGDLETARDTVQHNLHILADLAREGYLIVCSEPTAAVMLRHDALDLLDDPDARLIAGRVVELTAYLEDLHKQGQMKTDFEPLRFSVGHHVPCHVKALGRSPAGPRLLSLIPGLRLHTIDVHCSGMAGTFGLKAENYQLSIEAGRPMLRELAKPQIHFGSTECSTCRLQMEDSTGKRTLHPVQYLALAYGLMPGLSHRLGERRRRGLVLR